MNVSFVIGTKAGRAAVERGEGSVTVRRDGRVTTFRVFRTPDGFLLLSEGRPFDVALGTREGAKATIYVNRSLIPLTWHDARGAEPGTKEGSAGEREIRSTMPGRVARILVSRGDAVKAGDPLLVLEAMKMENEIKAAGDGVVEAVAVAEGASVESNALLVTLGEGPNADG